mgnify:CR=1 FL=1
MGTIFVNPAPNVTPIKVITAKAIIEPINTVKGLFVLLVITIAAICVLSPSSARKIDVKVAMSIFHSMTAFLSFNSTRIK